MTTADIEDHPCDFDGRGGATALRIVARKRAAVETKAARTPSELAKQRRQCTDAGLKQLLQRRA